MKASAFVLFLALGFTACSPSIAPDVSDSGFEHADGSVADGIEADDYRCQPFGASCNTNQVCCRCEDLVQQGPVIMACRLLREDATPTSGYCVSRSTCQHYILGDVLDH